MNKENDRTKLVSAWVRDILFDCDITGFEDSEGDIINWMLQVEAEKLEKLWLLAQSCEAQDAETWDPSFDAICDDLLAIYYPDLNPDLQSMTDMDIGNWKRYWDACGDTEDRPVDLVKWTVEFLYGDYAADFDEE